MKKIWSLILSLLFFLPLSCVTDDDDETPPAGNGTLEVTVTYNGSVDALSPDDLYVYVYTTLIRTSPRGFAPIAGNPGSRMDIDTGTAYTITMSGLVADDYYVVVFYDYYQGGSNIITKTDRYEIYNTSGGDGYVEHGETISITDGGTTSITVDFNDTYTVQDTSPISFMELP